MLNHYFFLEMILYCIFLGAFAGFLSGLLGIGGGVVIVPGLLFLFQQTHVTAQNAMHLAAGTSLAVVFVSSLCGLYAHRHRHDAEISPILGLLLPGVILGVVAGAMIAYFLKASTISFIFGIFLLCVACHMLVFGKANETRKMLGPVASNLVGSLIGVLSGMLGVGGGALIVPFLTYRNIFIRTAIIVSLTVSLTVSIVGSLVVSITGHFATGLPAWSTGYIYWPAWLGVTIGSALFVSLGVRFSYHLPVSILKRIFGTFLLLLGIRMLAS
jgi:uncharacterized membrane protein YfcA